MTSTKAQPGAFDGMERAAPDEPVFTLRAHDALAAPLVHLWVKQRREAINGADLTEEKRTLELIQCRDAEEIAFAMADWRKGTQASPAIVEEKPVAAYSGHSSSGEEPAAKARYDVVKGAAQAMHNSLSEAIDAANSLEPYGYAVERAVVIQAAGNIKAIALHIQPKRASYSIVDPEPEPFDVASLENRA